MSILGTYYTGLTSKPYAVTVLRRNNGIQITSTDESEYFSHFWPFKDVVTESFTSSNKIQLKYGREYPYQILELDESTGNEIIKAVLSNESEIKRIEYLITKANPFKVFLVSLFIILSVVAGYYFIVSPIIGEQAVKFLPRSVEEKAGKAMYNNMDFILKKDSTKSELLTEFYSLCDFKSEYDIRIDYSEVEMVNAFALPGGQIVVFDGIVDEMESWEELAALLGHEVAHVNERHAFRQLARSFSSYMILSVLTGDVAGTSAIILENASQVKELANSREYEKQADVYGLEYLKESKINPEAMATLFERLKVSNMIEDSEIYKKTEFISTHPLSAKRIEYIKEIIESDTSYHYEGIQIERAKEIFESLKND